MRYRLEIKEEARQQLRALPKEQRRNWHQYHAQCFLGDRLPLFLHDYVKGGLIYNAAQSGLFMVGVKF